eukprot:1177515-Prorocentrum_minimum.AAC.2
MWKSTRLKRLARGPLAGPGGLPNPFCPYSSDDLPAQEAPQPPPAHLRESSLVRFPVSFAWVHCMFGTQVCALRWNERCACTGHGGIRWVMGLEEGGSGVSERGGLALVHAVLKVVHLVNARLAGDGPELAGAEDRPGVPEQGVARSLNVERVQEWERRAASVTEPVGRNDELGILLSTFGLSGRGHGVIASCSSRSRAVLAMSHTTISDSALLGVWLVFMRRGSLQRAGWLH